MSDAGNLNIDARVARGTFELIARASIRLDAVTAVIGPSGSGKTTLLRLIAGLETGVGSIVAAGESWLEGSRAVPPHRRFARLVFQDARLFEHLDVRGNLQFASRRAPDRERPIPFEAVVQTLDLERLLRRRVTHLSGGERQRVALGRALLSQPRLLMLDEPLAAIDQQRRAEILPYLGRLTEDLGLPMLYVTHSLDEAVRLADHVLMMDAGSIVRFGPTAEVFAARIAQHHSTRLLTATVVDSDPSMDLVYLSLGPQLLAVPQLTPGPPPAGEVNVLIHARDVAVSLEPPRGISIRNVLPATVTAIRPDATGPFAHVDLDLSGQTLSARITRAAVTELSLALDQQVWALVKSASFDYGQGAPEGVSR